jgi:hypothetical protein
MGEFLVSSFEFLVGPSTKNSKLKTQNYYGFHITAVQDINKTSFMDKLSNLVTTQVARLKAEGFW